MTIPLTTIAILYFPMTEVLTFLSYFWITQIIQLGHNFEIISWINIQLSQILCAWMLITPLKNIF